MGCEAKARRAGIVVVQESKMDQAPSGATSSEYAAPDGAVSFVNDKLQRCRADGAGIRIVRMLDKYRHAK
jgi:hypothetical protein